MNTLFAQCLGSVLALLVGVVALKAARLVREMPGSMWLLTGMAFTVMGLSGMVQDAGAVWAYFSGKGTAPYELYMTLSPVGNYGRATLVSVFALLLVAAPFLRDLSAARIRRLLLGALVLGFALGGWVGSGAGRVVSARDWSMAAVLDTVELILLLGALMVGLVTAAMDSLLFVALAVYAFHAAINVASFSALAYYRVPDAWSPRPVYVALFIAATYAAVLAIAVRRLRLARRGTPVRPLMEPRVRTAPLFGS